MRQTAALTANEPLTCPMAIAPLHTGFSRSALYRAAAAGEIKLLKLGRTTLVDLASVRAYLDRLPCLTPKSKANNA